MRVLTYPYRLTAASPGKGIGASPLMLLGRADRFRNGVWSSMDAIGPISEPSVMSGVNFHVCGPVNLMVT